MGCGSSTALRQDAPGPQDTRLCEATLLRVASPSAAGIAPFSQQAEAATAHSPAVANLRQGLAGEEPTKLRTWSHRTHMWEDEEGETDLGSFPRNDRRSTRSSEFANALAILQEMPDRTAEQVRHRIATSNESVSMAMAAVSVVRIQRAARRFLRLRKTSHEASRLRASSPPAVEGRTESQSHDAAAVNAASLQRKDTPACWTQGGDRSYDAISRADTDKALRDPLHIDTSVAHTVDKAMARLDMVVVDGEDEAPPQQRVWSGIRYFQAEEVEGPKGCAHSPVMLTESMKRWSGVAYYNNQDDS
uniref:Uncharacterized protein n=1 Tax=Hemiselmis andersenii TaxID=464988 RepID=A0A6U2FR05_HEMAN|mmetsp:Transcript_33289/g.77916  ORF Transcript_33289/g.77916 Transcript_33289/m.77916 type:complete len:304 (+) Transcript_33289:126-1037(+)|eukprot:CAMPEP_0114142490 /NCGR_PEP_ID=MMETSP0043_2-20121206/18473_1 /TAXON_ID=464988 /ORGANISM="Hemiselmis andersenii, Strain CCMP644" /LENGTH=303 /DNA_ID=CAMNT_0001236709 /DNA_START=120 /DNA_END=1031 /DNA_ORIENTATION=+